MKKEYLNYKKALLGAMVISTSLTLSGCDKMISYIYDTNEIETEELSEKYLVEFINDKATIYNIAAQENSVEYYDNYVRILTQNYGIIDFNNETIAIFDNLNDANLFAISIVEDNNNIIYMDNIVNTKSLSK